MEKKYLIIGNGRSKEDNKPYSKGVAVKRTRDKTSEYADLKDLQYFEAIKPVGEMVTVTLSFK